MGKPSMSDETSQSVLTICCFLLLHTAAHFTALPLLRCLLPQLYRTRVDHLEPHLRVKLARLLRSTAFDAFAVWCGAALLYRCRTLHELTHVFTPLHEIAFQVALTHWLTSLVEDWAATSRAFVPRVASRRHTPVLESPAPDISAKLLQSVHLVHHAVAAVAFAFVLCTRLLGGMGAIGLLYEGPVIPMNVRELLCDFEEALGWWRLLGGRRTLLGAAFFCHLLWVPCRLGADCVYLYSLLHYEEGLGTLPTYAQYACHCFAAFFLTLNSKGWPYLAFIALADARAESGTSDEGQERQQTSSLTAFV